MAADVLIASLLTCRATVTVVMVWLIRSGVQAVTTQCRGQITRNVSFLTLIGRLSSHFLQLNRTSHVAFGVNAQQLTQEAKSKLKCVTQVSKLQNKMSLLQKAL